MNYVEDSKRHPKERKTDTGREDNIKAGIKDWVELQVVESVRAVEGRVGSRRIFEMSSVVPKRPQGHGTVD